MKVVFTSHGNRLNGLAQRLWYIAPLQRAGLDFHLYIDENANVSNDLMTLTKTLTNFHVHFVKDVGPITKMYYAVQEFRNEPLFIIDDDNNYNPMWLGYSVDNYISNYRRFYDCVIGICAKKIIKNNNNEWETVYYGPDQSEYQKTLGSFTGQAEPFHPSFRHQVYSGSPGSWIISNQLHEDFYDLDTYNKICFSDDEYWIWLHSIRRGYKHVCLNHSSVHPGDLSYQLNEVRLGDVNKSKDLYARNSFKLSLEKYPDIEPLLQLD